MYISQTSTIINEGDHLCWSNTIYVVNYTVIFYKKTTLSLQLEYYPALLCFGVTVPAIRDLCTILYWENKIIGNTY